MHIANRVPGLQSAPRAASLEKIGGPKNLHSFYVFPKRGRTFGTLKINPFFITLYYSVPMSGGKQDYIEQGLFFLYAKVY